MHNMSKRLAVIDCGTNTFNLLIIETTEIGHHTLFKSKLPVKIGEGGFQDHLIQPKRMLRGLDALLCHTSNCANFECDRIFAFATSAIRDAKNREEFLSLTRQLCGISIQLLSGEEEATYIARGVRKSMDLNQRTSLIMDIGGGSVEFIIIQGDVDLWKASYNLGVSRMFDLFFKTDISYTRGVSASSASYKSFYAHLSSEMQELIAAIQLYQPHVLVGSSGSFDTLLDMHCNKISMQIIDENICTEIPMNSFHKMHQWMMKSSLEERYAHPHIPAIRAEYMPISTLLIDFVLKESGIEQLMHSPFSLKEGLLDGLLSDETTHNIV